VAKAGDVIENPDTRERITFLKTTQETNGELLRFEDVLPPGFTIFEHFHPHQEERHEVLSGTLRGRVGGQERDYAAGERVVGPAGVPHAWRNSSSEDEELHIVSELRPPLRFETLFETSFGLSRDGKTTKKQGIPKNPLQLAVLVDEMRGMFYFSRVPVAVQEAFLALFAVVASVGRLLGYKARYPEYSGPEELPQREDRREGAVSKPMRRGVLAAGVLLTIVVLMLIRRRRRSSGR
jgi:quercetin dioxygenase-like cupin family protein